MTTWSFVCAAAAALLLSACNHPAETTQNALTANGAQSTSFKAATDNYAPEGLFVAAYQTAYTAQLAVYKGEATSTDSDRPYRNMASAGFGLVKTYCSDFFRKKGETQKWLNFSSDTVAALGALATGILAITGTSAMAVSIVALSSTTAANSIGIYEKNFLFGAENIDSVRTLVLNALSNNAATAMSGTDAWDFQYAQNAILVNQELCKPASILRLTRDAIAGGVVRSTDTTGSSTASDALVKDLIGQAAGIKSGNIALDSQIAALCWAASDPTADMTIVTKQVPLGQFTRGPAAVSIWEGEPRTSVANACRRLSSSADGQMKRQIGLWSPAGTSTPTPLAGQGTAGSQGVTTTTVVK